MVGCESSMNQTCSVQVPGTTSGRNRGRFYFLLEYMLEWNWGVCCQFIAALGMATILLRANLLVNNTGLVPIELLHLKALLF